MDFVDYIGLRETPLRLRGAQACILLTDSCDELCVTGTSKISHVLAFGFMDGAGD